MVVAKAVWTFGKRFVNLKPCNPNHKNSDYEHRNTRSRIGELSG